MILVVEDDPDSCDIMERLMKRFGYEVECASSAVAAMDALKTFPIRVAILDYNLPDHDGIWLLRQMNADPDLATVRSVFLSGTFEHDVARQAFEQGASEWFVKGVHDMSAIVERIDALYQRPSV